MTQFSVLADANELVCRIGLDAAAPAPPAPVAKVTALYTACNNQNDRNTNSLTAFNDAVVTPAITNPTSLESRVAALQLRNVAPLFATYVSADDKNTSRNSVRLAQGGLGLPDRDYYLKNKTDPVLVAYTKYIQSGLTWLGVSGDVNALSDSILEFETTLAQNSVPVVS